MTGTKTQYEIDRDSLSLIQELPEEDQRILANMIYAGAAALKARGIAAGRSDDAGAA